MAVGTDGRYYGEAEVKGKGSKEIREKLEAKAAEAQKKDAKSDPDIVEAPKPDDSPQVRDNAGSTVPLTGEDRVNPKTPAKK